MHADVNGRGYLFVREEGTVALGQRGHSPSSHMVSLGLFVAQFLPAVSLGFLSHQHDQSVVLCHMWVPASHRSRLLQNERGGQVNHGRVLAYQVNRRLSVGEI